MGNPSTKGNQRVVLLVRGPPGSAYKNAKINAGKNKWTPDTLQYLGISQLSPACRKYQDKLSIRWNHQMVQSHLIDGQKGLPEVRM